MWESGPKIDGEQYMEIDINAIGYEEKMKREIRSTTTERRDPRWLALKKKGGPLF